MLYVKFLRLMMNESIFFADKVAKTQRKEETICLKKFGNQ